MSDDSSKTKKLSLSGGKLTLGNIDASKLRTGPSIGGARKTVQVEVRRKRAPVAPGRGFLHQWTLLNQPCPLRQYLLLLPHRQLQMIALRLRNVQLVSVP